MNGSESKLTAGQMEAAREMLDALEECAEYIDQVSAIDPDDDPCAWPLVDGSTWCSALCKEHGCAKARTSLARKAIASARAAGINRADT